MIICKSLCGIYDNVSATGCNTVGTGGIGFWNAGQREDPNTGSAFLWRTSAGVTAAMTFTDWGIGEPNGGQSEGCAHFWAGLSWQWNDFACTGAMCYVCEIDMN